MPNKTALALPRAAAHRLNKAFFAFKRQTMSRYNNRRNFITRTLKASPSQTLHSSSAGRHVSYGCYAHRTVMCQVKIQMYYGVQVKYGFFALIPIKVRLFNGIVWRHSVPNFI